MKKNTMMRVASALLVAVLLTTCAISGTFAKYVTSAEAQDSARVAKWGVVVGATGDEAFAEKYNDAANAAGTKVVSSVSGQDVLAPGTNGNLGGISITGKPEVMVDIAVTADLSLTGWKLDASTEYCPIIFTVGSTDIKIDGTTIKTVAELEAAVEKAFTDLSATNVAANTDLARSVSITWRWDFAGDDVKDTQLGNLATAPQISFECEVTVTQVD